MAWYAYASNSNLIKNSGALLSAETVAGTGIWLSNRDITDTTIPSLNSASGILLNLEGCFSNNSNVTSQYTNPQSECLHWPVCSAYWFGVGSEWQHNSNYPWIGLISARLFLCKQKGGNSGVTYSTISANRVYLTNAFNGIINDTIKSSPQADNPNDSYPYLFASGAYDTFPDYRVSSGVTESFCYGPTLTSISSYSDINNYLSNGYYYVGVELTFTRQQFFYNNGGQGSTYFYIWGMATSPVNDYCTASYSMSFTGSKVNIGGSWQNIAAAKVYVDGAWKPVTGMKVYQGGSWKPVPQTQTISWAQK